MPETVFYPRLAENNLLEALTDSPVVLIHGPRQCGKTTLARMIGERLGYSYITFGDDVARLAAEADPAWFVDSLPSHVVLDEVQRTPQLFTALKAMVDRRRAPGRFLLTGSANVLLVPHLADSLADGDSSPVSPRADGAGAPGIDLPEHAAHVGVQDAP